MFRLYEYKCDVCNNTEEHLDDLSSTAFTIHYCTVCENDCVSGVRINLTTGDSVRHSSGSGAHVAMVRTITAPQIHQTGYQPDDARYSRGRG